MLPDLTVGVVLGVVISIGVIAALGVVIFDIVELLARVICIYLSFPCSPPRLHL
jgi:hypothetical protein